MPHVVIHLLSADHRTHGLDVVARLGATAAHLGPDLLATVPGVDGVVVLGTCNRLALLLDVPAAPYPGTSPTTLDVPDAVTCFLAARAGLPVPGEPAEPTEPAQPSEPAEPAQPSESARPADAVAPLRLERWTGPDAVAELFSTAAGLESMVVGEREIAGQLRRAMILAHHEGTLTGPLARLIEHASSTSRLVARSTGLSGTGRSVVAVGLDLAARELPPMERLRVLVVGTGAYAGATVTALRERGVTDIAVYSRSDRAKAFADGHHLRCVAHADLPGELALADLVVTCRGLGSPVLTRELLAPVARLRQPSEPALLDRHEDPASPADPSERPLVVLDLALTRDVERSVADLPGVLLIDLPAVQAAVPEAEARQVADAAAIVAAEAQDYCRLAGGRRMDPVISALRTHVEELVAAETERLRVRDGMVDADDAARALRHLANRLLHHPSVAARQAGEAGLDEEYLAALPMLLGERVAGALMAGLDAPDACPVRPSAEIAATDAPTCLASRPLSSSRPPAGPGSDRPSSPHAAGTEARPTPTGAATEARRPGEAGGGVGHPCGKETHD